MFLELTRLVDGCLEETFRLEPGSTVFEGFEGEIQGPFELEATLRHPTGDTYLLEARLHGAVTRPCRRCLVGVPLEVLDRFRVVYQISDRDRDAGDDDVVLLEPGASRIELAETVRDRLFLGTEEYPLCREDCAGFCPRCGQDLNLGPCTCEPEAGESPWAEALQAVRDRIHEPG